VERKAPQPAKEFPHLMEHENIYRAEQHTRPCLYRGQNFTRH